MIGRGYTHLHIRYVTFADMEEEDLPDTDDLCSISLIKRPEWISINLKIVKKKSTKISSLIVGWKN